MYLSSSLSVSNEGVFLLRQRKNHAVGWMGNTLPILKEGLCPQMKRKSVPVSGSVDVA